ncbi:hypothetical protein LguiA_001049 [Lonicera macranthoides]
MVNGGRVALPRGPAGPETTFNVMQFGAKVGKHMHNTQAFIKAWRAACDFNGKAKVLVPMGEFTLAETLFTGPCKGPDPVTIQVMGTIKSVDDPSEYSGNGWIQFDSINGLVLIGGTLDAQGKAMWEYNDCKSNPHCVHLPATLYFNGVDNAKIKRVTLLNSMGFHMHVTNCNMFRVSGITISAPRNSPNTDGIHISKSQTVIISRSTIGTGDDCISVGHGSTNVTINEVICGPGHGISIGSLGKVRNEQDVRGIVAKNCTLVGTTNGVRIKTWPASGASKASGILFGDIIMENVDNPIIIDQSYGTKSKKPSRVKISDVFYQDIRGTTIAPVAVNLMCSPGGHCENVHLENINLRSKDNLVLTSRCANAHVGYTGIQIPPPCR